MINAKLELLDHLKNKPKLKCAEIIIEKESDFDSQTIISLKCEYTSKDLENFLENIDFDYNNGFGGQEIFGTLWFEDGNWSERGEYDGNEQSFYCLWWRYHKMPEIPNNLKNTK